MKWDVQVHGILRYFRNNYEEATFCSLLISTLPLSLGEIITFIGNEFYFVISFTVKLLGHKNTYVFQITAKYGDSV